MIKHIADKGKEVGSSSEGRNRAENGASQSISINSKEAHTVQAKDKGIMATIFTLSLVNDVTQMLPKIELVTFEGKEPRAWLRKCMKYFEIYMGSY